MGGLVPKKCLPSLRICKVVWRTSITRKKLANHSNPFQRNVEWDYFWRYWLAHTLCSSQVIIIAEFSFVHHFHEIFSLTFSQDTINADESTLFEAMLRWAVKECERRGLESNEPDSQRRCLGEALFLIRYLTFAGT